MFYSTHKPKLCMLDELLCDTQGKKKKQTAITVFSNPLATCIVEV